MKVVVLAHPGSSRSFVKKDMIEDEVVYRVYTHKKALDGAANEAIHELLADYFGVKKYDVVLVTWEKFRKKIFQIKAK